jgi:hypothetical protein
VDNADTEQATGRHDVYCRLTEADVHSTQDLVEVQIDRDAAGEIVGVEILDVHEVTIDGQPADARPPDVDVCVPPRTWIAVPGTSVQVRHEAEGAAWYRPCLDGSLILREPGVGWTTRIAPE